MTKEASNHIVSDAPAKNYCHSQAHVHQAPQKYQRHNESKEAELDFKHLMAVYAATGNVPTFCHPITPETTFETRKVVLATPMRYDRPQVCRAFKVAHVHMGRFNDQYYYYALDDVRGYHRLVDLRDFAQNGTGAEWRQYKNFSGYCKQGGSFAAHAIAFPIEVSDLLILWPSN